MSGSAKYFVLFFLLSVPLAGLRAQGVVRQVVKEYYRVDPFQGSFSGFVNALSNDTALHNRQMYKQTDTTGFFLRGNYHVFNPFSINANKVDMVFLETPESIRKGLSFSYYLYQVTAYFPDNEPTRTAIKKEYKRLVKKIRQELRYTNVQSLKNYKGVEDGEVISLSYMNGVLQPVLVSWQTLTQTRQVALTLVIKIVQRNNRASLLGSGFVDWDL